MIKVEFSGQTAEEVNEQVKDYASKIKGSRGGKNTGDAEQANPAQQQPSNPPPPPMQPPANPGVMASPMPQTAPMGTGTFGGQASGFPGAAPLAPGAGPAQGFPAAAAQSGPSAEVQALVQRIVARTDGAIQSGQPPAAVLDWFQKQLAPSIPEAANASLDQIKQTLLYRLQPAQLTQIAGFLGGG